MMKLAQICFEVAVEGSSALDTDEEVLTQKNGNMGIMRN
jgi:hypothetical protein